MKLLVKQYLANSGAHQHWEENMKSKMIKMNWKGGFKWSSGLIELLAMGRNCNINPYLADALNSLLLFEM